MAGKRYMGFGSDRFYPSCGIYDLVVATDDKVEAIQVSQRNEVWNVYDTENDTITNEEGEFGRKDYMKDFFC